VLDVAESAGARIALLGQSYMPAQDFHVLHTPGRTGGSPWYPLRELDTGLDTPEWGGFTRRQVRSFGPSGAP